MPKNTVVVPAYPEPYIRKKRGRPKKIGRPKKDPYVGVRASPSKRAGARFRSVSVTEECYYILKELAEFYKCTPGLYVYTLVLPAFDHAHEESMALQRIGENREKAEQTREALKKKEPDEIQNRTQPARRDHF